MKVLGILLLFIAFAMATIQTLLSPNFHQLLKINNNDIYGMNTLEKYQNTTQKEKHGARDIIECSKVSKCATAGQSCESPYTFEFVLCMYSYCDSSDKCAAYHADGGSCSTTEMGRECQLKSSCIGGTCFRDSKPGDNCTSSSECTLFSTNNTIEHSCVNNQCAGYGINQTCKWDVNNPQAQCAKGMICDIINERCVPLKGLNERCLFQDCQAGLVCIMQSSPFQCQAPLAVGAACSYVHECGYDTCVPTDQAAKNSVCAPPFSVKEGAFCKSSKTGFSPQCEDGLACIDPSGSGVGVCTNPKKKKSSSSSDGDDDKSCYTQNHCSNSEICKCNTNTGDGECYGPPISPKGSFKSYQNLLKCAIKSCPVGDGQTQCLIDKCGGEQCAYERTVLPALSHVGATPLPKCAINSYRCANSASAVKISLSLLFVALLLLL